MPKEKQTSEKEKQQINFVTERFEKMYKKRADFESDWNQADKQYQMYHARRPKEQWRADLRLPMTFSVIETALAEMVDQSPGINLLPRETADITRAETLEKVYKYTWEKGNGEVELMSFVKDVLIKGTGIGEEYYRQDVIVKKEIADFDLEKFTPTGWQERKELGFDDCYFESIPIWDFFVDPRSVSLETAVDCIKRVKMSKDDFIFKFERRYAKARKIAAGGGSAFNDNAWYKPTEVFGDDEIEVFHYYNKQKDLYLIMANGKLLTDWDNPNPYKHKDFPFVRGVDVMLPHSFYGMGEPKIIQALEEELNTIRNMRLDTAHLNIHTMFLVDDRLELDDDDLVARPHGAIKGPAGSITPVPDKPLKHEAYREEELLKDDMIRATGIDPRLQSIGGRGDTATEVAILKESSLKRIRLKLRLLERIALHRLARLRISNIQQFYSIPRVVQVIGDNGQPTDQEVYKYFGYKDRQGNFKTEQAKPQDITGEFDIIVIPGSTLPISKTMEAQKSINLFDRLKGHPDVNQRKLVEDVIRANDKNPSELLTQPGEPPLGQAPGAMPIPPTERNMPGANQRTVKAQDLMPQKIMGGTPNLNQ